VIHEDTWAPFAYSFTEDNYLDVITGKCTLYLYAIIIALFLCFFT